MIKWKNFVRSSTGRHFGSGEQLRQHSTGASPQLHRRHVPHRGREPHQRLAEEVNESYLNNRRLYSLFQI